MPSVDSHTHLQGEELRHAPGQLQQVDEHRERPVQQLPPAACVATRKGGSVSLFLYCYKCILKYFICFLCQPSPPAAVVLGMLVIHHVSGPSHAHC